MTKRESKSSFVFATLCITFALLLTVSSDGHAGYAWTTAYIEDTNAPIPPDWRTSDKYEIEIIGDNPANNDPTSTVTKPLHVYGSTNDILWNGGNKCLVGNNPPSSAECLDNESSSNLKDKMSDQNHWASFDFVSGAYSTGLQFPGR